MPEYLLPAFVETEPESFKPGEDCTVAELQAAEVIARDHRPVDTDLLRGIRKWIQLKAE